MPVSELVLMVYQPTGSIYQVLSSEVATKHGLNVIYGGNEGIMRTLNQSMINDFDPENVAQLATSSVPRNVSVHS